MIPFLTYALFALSEPLSEEEFLSLALAHGWKQRPNSKNVEMEGYLYHCSERRHEEAYSLQIGQIPITKGETIFARNPKAGAGQNYKTPTRDELIRMITEKTAW